MWVYSLVGVYSHFHLTRLGDAGVCDILGKCLLRGINENSTTCAWVCRAVGTVATDQDHNTQLLVDAGVCEFVVQALQKYLSSIDLVAEACFCIRSMAQLYRYMVFSTYIIIKFHYYYIIWSLVPLYVLYTIWSYVLYTNVVCVYSARVRMSAALAPLVLFNAAKTHLNANVVVGEAFRGLVAFALPGV